MGRYLDPKYDLPFKLIFGGHKNLCLSLINSMLPFDEDRRAESIEYETSELIPEIRDLKHSVVDVRCTDNYGRQFIVEMQMTWTESFKSRVLLNASKAYVRKFDASQDYRLLCPVYAINFVNGVFEKSPEMRDEYYHHYRIVNVRHTEKRIEGLELVFIELPKFRPDTRATRRLHDLWMRFLTEINESTEEAPPELLTDEDIREAVHYTEVGAYSKGQLLAYDRIKMAVADERSLMSGLRDEGRKEGRKEGDTEATARIAARALKKGMSPEDVSELTGLPLNEIRRLNRLTDGM
ncbi:MAG: Rpn family recombination-promoting nuclease/putative transposase [Tannerella sp.]|jgi:predicted transposase/invertase (TIGR01784 family)|nr:Rpn family recombination-promoting nuclease/putative transposase [Tannerella sp.]